MYGPGGTKLFDVAASLYDVVMPPVRTTSLRANLRRVERPVGWVLDLAGGPGRAVRRLDVPYPVVADAAPGMVRRARAHGCTAVCADAGRLPFRDDVFDAALLVDALHHLPAPLDAFDEAYRVVRPGGGLVVRDFDPTTVRGRALAAAERAVGFDSTFTDPVGVARALERRGFESTISETGFGYTVVGVVPKREGN